MISEETKNKWRDKINFCVDNQDKLSEWEMDFIDSIDDWLSKGKDLTHKQTKVLNRIFEKVGG
jgi:hypothetical protein